MNDFGKLYYSSKDFLNGLNMYGPNQATLIPIDNTVGKQFWNLNPPHFHIILLPLALLTPNKALGFWGLLSLFSLIISLYFIAREICVKLTPFGILVCIFCFLLFSGTSAILVTGQLTFLLLLPVTLSWISARRGKWTQAGVYIGLVISVKPFLLIFLPYMILLRKYRAVTTACSTTLVCYATGLLVFGIDQYRSWWRTFSLVDWSWAAMNGSIMGLLTRIFSSSPYYTPIAENPKLVLPIWIGTVVIIGLLTMYQSVMDDSNKSIDRSFSMLLVCALLISPIGWVYYIFFLLGPITALIYSWSKNIHKNNNSKIVNIVLLRNISFIIASTCLICPYCFTIFLQPMKIATITIGSIYFWSYLAIWGGLTADWLLENRFILIPKHN